MNKWIRVKNCFMFLLVKQGSLFGSNCFSVRIKFQSGQIRIPSDRPPLDAELIHATSTAYELEEKGIFGSIGRFGQCVWPVFQQVVVGREWCWSFSNSSSSNSSFNHSITRPQLINFTPDPEAQDCRWVARISKSKIPLAKRLGHETSVASETAGIKNTFFLARFVIHESISKISHLQVTDGNRRIATWRTPQKIRGIYIYSISDLIFGYGSKWLEPTSKPTKMPRDQLNPGLRSCCASLEAIACRLEECLSPGVHCLCGGHFARQPVSLQYSWALWSNSSFFDVTGPKEMMNNASVVVSLGSLMCTMWFWDTRWFVPCLIQV